MNKTITIILVIVLLLGVFLLIKNQNSSVTVDNSSAGIIEGPPTEPFVPTSENYLDYSPDLLSRADNGKVVLFFKANWCPTCNALDKDIKSNLTSLPDDVTILKVDYDTATELKRKYNVVTQHTMVQVDSSGNELNKWVGGNTLKILLSKVN